MKIFVNIIFCIVTFLNIITFSGCSTGNGYEKKDIGLPRYSDVTVIENKGHKGELFDIHDNQLVKNKTLDNVSEMLYNIQKSVCVYLVNGNKTEKIGNRIIVLYRNEKNKIKNFFSAEDIKLNPSGDKIAYRAFESPSADSARGMQVYDLRNKKYMELKSKVLVSGNLYEWLDDHRIIYYGSVEGERNSSKIYMYDFHKGTEQVYLNNTLGYCTYFTTVEGNLFFLSRNQEKLNLYYYNHETGRFQFLSDGFEQVYNSVVDSKNDHIFFIGRNEGNKDSLYEFSQREGSIHRITYDFPVDIAEHNGMAQDKKGNLYFVGVGEEGKSQDVFMYDSGDKSINIISDHEGMYNIYREN